MEQDLQKEVQKTHYQKQKYVSDADSCRSNRTLFSCKLSFSFLGVNYQDFGNTFKRHGGGVSCVS